MYERRSGRWISKYVKSLFNELTQPKMTKARGLPLVEEPATEHCSGVHISAAATTFSHTVIFRVCLGSLH